jgi:hypothetical protein
MVETMGIKHRILIAALVAGGFTAGFVMGHKTKQSSVYQDNLNDVMRIIQKLGTLDVETKKNADSSYQEILKLIAENDKKTHEDIEFLNSRLESIEILLTKKQTSLMERDDTTLYNRTQTYPEYSAELTENQVTEHTEAYSKIDYSEVTEALANMYSTDIDVRTKYLKALILLGSSEIKEEIGQIILDETENTELRRDLIKELDWQGISPYLITLLETSKDHEIRFAAVSAIEDSAFSEAEKSTVDIALLQSFHTEQEDYIKNAIIGYFSGRNSDEFTNLLSSIDENTISSDVKDHIQFLLTPPEALPQPLEVQTDPG